MFLRAASQIYLISLKGSQRLCNKNKCYIPLPQVERIINNILSGLTVWLVCQCVCVNDVRLYERVHSQVVGQWRGLVYDC